MSRVGTLILLSHRNVKDSVNKLALTQSRFRYIPFQLSIKIYGFDECIVLKIHYNQDCIVVYEYRNAWKVTVECGDVTFVYTRFYIRPDHTETADVKISHQNRKLGFNPDYADTGTVYVDDCLVWMRSDDSVVPYNAVIDWKNPGAVFAYLIENKDALINWMMDICPEDGSD